MPATFPSPSSAVSDHFNMTEDLAVSALGSTHAFDDAVEDITFQRQEYKQLEHERAYAQLNQEGKREKKEELLRDVWFLKREVQEKKDAEDAKKQAHREEKRKERVKRYLREQKQELEAGIWREKVEGERVRKENEVLARELEECEFFPFTPFGIIGGFEGLLTSTCSEG